MGLSTNVRAWALFGSTCTRDEPRGCQKPAISTMSPLTEVATPMADCPTVIPCGDAPVAPITSYCSTMLDVAGSAAAIEANARSVAAHARTREERTRPAD